jgi:hypothetical protein
MDELPRNATGKVLKRELRDSEQNGDSEGSDESGDSEDTEASATAEEQEQS